jgi:hypothetical protein
LRVELSEIFEKRTQESFFEKRTQSYQTLKMTLTKKRTRYLLHNCNSVINSSDGCVVQVMELLQVEFSENFKKRTQKSFFEKRTQKYQTLKTDFDQKKHPLFATQKVQ